MSTWQPLLDEANVSLEAWDIAACRAAAADARALAASWGESAAVAMCDLVVERAALLVHTMLRAEIALASGEPCDAVMPELSLGCTKDAIIAAALVALARFVGP